MTRRPGTLPAPRRGPNRAKGGVSRPPAPGAQRDGTLAASDPVRFSLAERRGFTRFTAEEAGILVPLREAMDANGEQLVEAFYRHLLSFEPLRPFLADPAVVRRVKAVQRAYLLSLTAPECDEDYLADRLRIGRVHERIGLHPQWYLGSYGVLLDSIIPLVRAHYRDDTAACTRALGALVKRMNLDAQLVLDAYIEARQQRAVEHAEQLAAVGELAASIAHEVRNPLAGMKGAMEVLRKSLAVDGATGEVMDEVVAQIVRLEILVRDLLQFARPHPPSRKPVQLHALLDRALRLAQEDSGNPAVEVRRDFPAGSGRAVGDPQQLEQVFLNLIHNALQAMEDGGVLTVSTRKGTGTVLVTVQDNGKGIAAGDLPKIFLPFYTTKHRGSGLGLPIVRKIAEAHGGSIEVRSEPGMGTTATVILPGIEAE